MLQSPEKPTVSISRSGLSQSDQTGAKPRKKDGLFPVFEEDDVCSSDFGNLQSIWRSAPQQIQPKERQILKEKDPSNRTSWS